jgi:hypothetical protein
MHGLREIQRQNREASLLGGQPVAEAFTTFTPDVQAYFKEHPLATVTEALKACEQLPAAIAQAEAEDFDYQQAHEDITQ